MNNKRIKELSEIVSLDLIEDSQKPILEAHGLPNQCYTNQDYLTFEKEKFLTTIG
jgi:choline monooxygenase